MPLSKNVSMFYLCIGDLCFVDVNSIDLCVLYMTHLK